MDVAHFAAFINGDSSSSSSHSNSSSDRYREYYDSGSGSVGGVELCPPLSLLVGLDEPGLFAAYQVDPPYRHIYTSPHTRTHISLPIPPLPCPPYLSFLPSLSLLCLSYISRHCCTIP